MGYVTEYEVWVPDAKNTRANIAEHPMSARSIFARLNRIFGALGHFILHHSLRLIPLECIPTKAHPYRKKFIFARSETHQICFPFAYPPTT